MIDLFFNRSGVYMSLSNAATLSIVQEYQREVGDSGSPEVQIALLSKRILLLTEHLKKNRNDNISAHGLSLLVSKRRRLLRYLQKSSVTRYRSLIQSLGLRG